MQLGKVAVQGPQVAALDEQLAAAAEHDGAKAVPLGLEEESFRGRQLVGELGEHRLDRAAQSGTASRTSSAWPRVFRPASWNGSLFVLRSRTMANDAKLRLGVSACLLGNEVRYDGGHKRNAVLTDLLGPFVEWVPICPEVEAGFGTPREAMHLVTDGSGVRLLTVRIAARRHRSARTGGGHPVADAGPPRSRRLRAQEGLALVRPLPREGLRPFRPAGGRDAGCSPPGSPTRSRCCRSKRRGGWPIRACARTSSSACSPTGACATSWPAPCVPAS